MIAVYVADVAIRGTGGGLHHIVAPVDWIYIHDNVAMALICISNFMEM